MLYHFQVEIQSKKKIKLDLYLTCAHILCCAGSDTYGHLWLSPTIPIVVNAIYTFDVKPSLSEPVHLAGWPAEQAKESPAEQEQSPLSLKAGHTMLQL